MRHFFSSQHVPSDVVERLCDASEVLLANAFYAAPVAAGASGPIPIQRTVNVEFPDDPACRYLDRQYMLGGSLLIAPIFAHDGVVEYYLPRGRWTNPRRRCSATPSPKFPSPR